MTQRDYEFVAVVRCPISYGVIAKVSSSTMEGLQEELYKLEKAVEDEEKEIEKDMVEFEHHRLEKINN